MNYDLKQAWILTGYELFAQEGPKGLKVEVIARKVNKSKSSFYHLFADMEVFTECLLEHHLHRVKHIVEREKNCQNVIPDLLDLLLEVKQDLFFNRQLRIHRNIPHFKKCLDKVNKIEEDAILEIWAEVLGLSDRVYIARIMLALAAENFFLQITEESFTREWFSEYIREISFMVKEIKNHRTN